ncbi:MAG: biopolymer transporter ExbD [Bacteroidia bacterium]|nr:MAG: biopolymer transporter ExbD [Bacteroidia bacterium]
MAIKARNTRNVQFSMASMSDLVFLLLIFFMLTSTLVAPSAINLLLPSSDSRTMVPQTVNVHISADRQVFLEDIPVDMDALQSGLIDRLEGHTAATVVLRTDHTVPVQYIVNVIDVVENINSRYQVKHRVILATQPRR